MNLEWGNIGWFLVLSASLLWFLEFGFSLGTITQPGISLSSRWVRCPIRERETEVEFLARAGVPYEINRCSAFGKDEVTCGKLCLQDVRAEALPLSEELPHVAAA